jgi:hypothetical protein
MLKLKKYFLFAGLVMLVSSLTIIACSKDEEGDTMEPDRNKFIGDYIGSVACAGVFNSIIGNDEQEFSIVEKLGGADSELTISFDGGVPISFSGTVTGDTLFIMETIEQVPIPFGDQTITADLDVVGKVGINAAHTEIDADLNLKATAGILVLSDMCSVVGIKK